MNKIPPPILSESRGLNTSSDTLCRTLKAVYYKVSLANFIHKQDGFGATGAMAIYETQ